MGNAVSVPSGCGCGEAEHTSNQQWRFKGTLHLIYITRWEKFIQIKHFKWGGWKWEGKSKGGDEKVGGGVADDQK